MNDLPLPHFIGKLEKERTSRKAKNMKKHIGTILLVFILFCGIGVFFLFFYINNTIRNAYAQEWVAGMVISHLEDNNQQWPKSWQELIDDYEKSADRPWTFQELSKRVVVDWNIQTNSLRKSITTKTHPFFRVIFLRDGSRSHWQGHEANDMILQYLQTHPPIVEGLEQKTLESQ